MKIDKQKTLNILNGLNALLINQGCSQNDDCPTCHFAHNNVCDFVNSLIEAVEET